MEIYRFDDVNQFYEQAQDYLLSDEAHHCLLLRIIHTLIQNPERYQFPAYLAIAETNGEIAAVAVRTPPYKLVLSRVVDFAALEVIAEDLHNQQALLPGVSGLVEEAQAFAEIWQRVTGATYTSGIQMRIHQLTAVQPTAKASGYLRHAEAGDIDLVLEWFEAFFLEALGFIEEDLQRLVSLQLSKKVIYLWEDIVPVSIASGKISTPNGGWIGPVYTPVEYRQKGYATSCVAALSQTLLDQGCRSCFLFTDITNPTSNHIYHTIGYQPVCDWHDYTFENY